MNQASIDSTLVPEVKDQVFVTTSILWKMHNVTYFGVTRTGLGSSEPPSDLLPAFTSGNSTSRLHECPHCNNALNSSNVFYNDSMFPTETIPYSFSIVLIALYTFTTLAAVIGNSLVIIVFAKGKRSNTDLRSFLINLAVADLIMAIVCIPFTFAYQITENWIFPDVLCPIVQCCQQVSVLASVCTNTSIGIDRLIAVKFPLRKRVTNSRSKVVILCIWILAWSLGVIPLVKSRTLYKDRKLRCEENWATEPSRLAFGFFIMIITYFLPVTILSVTYAMIGRQLWKHKLPGNADDHRDAVQLKSKRKVVKMLVTIVLLFGVCWLPLHIFIIIITFNIDFFGKDANTIYFGVHWLSMANSFVNPLIYGFMNESFRADLNSMVHSCLRRRWGHKRLKHRSAALRWKLGDCNVHDAGLHVQPRGYMTKSLRTGLDDRGNRRHWRNGHARSTPALDVASLCSCDLNSVSSFNNTEYSELNMNQFQSGGKSIYASGKRRTFNSRDAANFNSDESGLKLAPKCEHSRKNAKRKCTCDLRSSALYDGCDVILLQETKRKENG